MTEQENIDQFKKMLEDDPASKAFAPLAEGYRKMGMLEKALQIALDGVAINPHFNSGKVALAKVLMDLKRFSAAEELLKEVCSKDFDNLLAHRLLGEIFINNGNLESALESFKAALLANPMDRISAAMVSKLESVSAKQFEPDLFKGLDKKDSAEQKTIHNRNMSLHSSLSYIDVLITRNSYAAAMECTEDCLLKFPNSPELKKRKGYLQNLKSYSPNISRKEALTKPEVNKRKLRALNKALENINQQMKTRPELYKANGLSNER